MVDEKEQARIAKNAAISAAQKKTRSKRKSQVCQVFQLKVQANHLSKNQKEAVSRQFVEAKWLYNDILRFADDPNGPSVWDYKLSKTVTVLDKDGYEREEALVTLGSQVRQSILQGIKSSINGLAQLKKKGHKVGSLKFRSEINSIELKQYNTTFRVRGSKVKIQNIPGWLRVRGADQITDDYEIANAKLVRTARGLYLYVTTYVDQGVYAQIDKTKDFNPGTSVGIDMGIKTHLTLSNGEKFDVKFAETERLKRLSQRINRQEYRSNGWNRTLNLIEREYEKMDNRKDDWANKFVHELLATYETVYFQDENISGWKPRKRTGKDKFIRNGRSLQHSVLGRVKSRLRDKPRAVMLDRWLPTTATCQLCGLKTKHAPTKRVFKCPDCGYTADRDVHAAENMILFGTNQLVPRGPRKPGAAPPPLKAGGDGVSRAGLRPGMRPSMKPEAATSLVSP